MKEMVIPPEYKEYKPEKCPECGASVTIEWVPVEVKRIEEAPGVFREKIIRRPYYTCTGPRRHLVTRIITVDETISYLPPKAATTLMIDMFGDYHFFVDTPDKKVVYKPGPARLAGYFMMDEELQVVLRKRVTIEGWCEVHERVHSALFEETKNFVFSRREVQMFKRILDRMMEVYGRKPTVKDGILAFMLMNMKGTKGIITGFLRAIAPKDPDKYAAFDGVAADAVGWWLSKLRREGVLLAPEEDIDAYVFRYVTPEDKRVSITMRRERIMEEEVYIINYMEAAFIAKELDIYDEWEEFRTWKWVVK